MPFLPIYLVSKWRLKTLNFCDKKKKTMNGWCNFSLSFFKILRVESGEMHNNADAYHIGYLSFNHFVLKSSDFSPNWCQSITCCYNTVSFTSHIVRKFYTSLNAFLCAIIWDYYYIKNIYWQFYLMSNVHSPATVKKSL